MLRLKFQQLLWLYVVVIVITYILNRLLLADHINYIFKRISENDRTYATSVTYDKSSRFGMRKLKYPNEDLVHYDRDVPLIWVGGMPRSGTTLMRVMLDAHKDIRCGEETRVIPRILAMHGRWMESEVEQERLKAAGLTEEVLDYALGAYILSIIANHGESAPRLCNKDPFTLKSMGKILNLFPQSKFIFMIRDGRATVHSIISRNITIAEFDTSTYRGALVDWNKAVAWMNKDCETVGPEICLPVYYELLVSHPRKQMRRISKFLGIEWDDMVLHHEKTINKTGGVSLSGKEYSTEQVKEPINSRSLVGWVRHIPPDVRRDMHRLAPMLRYLGYDPFAYPPNYGKADQADTGADINRKLVNNFFKQAQHKTRDRIHRKKVDYKRGLKFAASAERKHKDDPFAYHIKNGTHIDTNRKLVNSFFQGHKMERRSRMVVAHKRGSRSLK